MLKSCKLNTINYVPFPAVENADNDGLLAMGGDLSIDTLVSAYSQGIFPWFNHGQPVLWWSPDPRLVLYPNKIKVSRSLKKKLRQQRFRVSCNQAFEQVITSCALRGQTINNSKHNKSVEESEPENTWITQSMSHAYTALNSNGYAHSIEVWDEDGRLVGGLYGLALGEVFFGESMFSLVADASKIALSNLCAWLKINNYKIIDCQVTSDHLLSLGAEEIRRSDFLPYLNNINIHQRSKEFAQDISQLPINSVINTV